MSKAIIAPIVAVLALAVQAIFGITIPEDVVNQVVLAIGNVVLVVASIVGIVKSHQKKEEDEQK